MPLLEEDDDANIISGQFHDAMDQYMAKLNNRKREIDCLDIMDNNKSSDMAQREVDDVLDIVDNNVPKGGTFNSVSR